MFADGSKGFGGRFGVQTDRQDKSARGWDDKAELNQHESQKGWRKQVKAAQNVRARLQITSMASAGVTVYKRIAKIKLRTAGINKRRSQNTKVKTVGLCALLSFKKAPQHATRMFADYKHGFGAKFGIQADRQDKSAHGWEDRDELAKHESQARAEVPRARASDLRSKFEALATSASNGADERTREERERRKHEDEELRRRNADAEATRQRELEAREAARPPLSSAAAADESSEQSTSSANRPRPSIGVRLPIARPTSNDVNEPTVAAAVAPRPPSPPPPSSGAAAAVAQTPLYDDIPAEPAPTRTTTSVAGAAEQTRANMRAAPPPMTAAAVHESGAPPPAPSPSPPPPTAPSSIAASMPLSHRRRHTTSSSSEHAANDDDEDWADDTPEPAVYANGGGVPPRITSNIVVADVIPELPDEPIESSAAASTVGAAIPQPTSAAASQQPMYDYVPDVPDPDQTSVGAHVATSAYGSHHVAAASDTYDFVPDEPPSTPTASLPTYDEPPIPPPTASDGDAANDGGSLTAIALYEYEKQDDDEIGFEVSRRQTSELKKRSALDCSRTT